MEKRLAPRRIPTLNRLRLEKRRWHGKNFGYRHRYAFDWLRRGDVVIDCGANIGKVTRLLHETGATVHAFEPDGVAFGELKRRFNGVPGVTLYRAGVGAEAGTLRLYSLQGREAGAVKGSVSSSLLADKPNVDTDAFEEVNVVDLADFIEVLDAPVALLKIDIEGMELAVLDRLLDRGLHERIGLILVETHVHSIPAIAAGTAALKERCRALGARHVYFNWQ